MIDKMVAGFLFSNNRRNVVLIRKTHPPFMAGKLNGVGGHVEPGETPLEAMRREFFEETGMKHNDWTPKLVLNGKYQDGELWEVTFFVGFAHADDIFRLPLKHGDEYIEVHECHSGFVHRSDTLFNLKWIVPLLLDKSVQVGLVSESSPFLSVYKHGDIN